MSELTTIEIDVEEEYHPTVMALGLRLAILQGVYDCTYEEINKVVAEKFKDRKVIAESESSK